MILDKIFCYHIYKRTFDSPKYVRYLRTNVPDFFSVSAKQDHCTGNSWYLLPLSNGKFFPTCNFVIMSINNYLEQLLQRILKFISPFYLFHSVRMFEFSFSHLFLMWIYLSLLMSPFLNPHIDNDELFILCTLTRRISVSLQMRNF